jgi:hypothetical protein
VNIAASTLGDSFSGEYDRIADIEWTDTRIDGGWLCLGCDWGTCHIVPVLDGVLHHVAEGDECMCLPNVEPCERNDGSFGFVASHSSLDGREIHESP